MFSLVKCPLSPLPKTLIKSEKQFNRVLTTISPFSFVSRIKRTPESVVISRGTGMVFNSFIGKRNAATFAIRCRVGTRLRTLSYQ